MIEWLEFKNGKGEDEACSFEPFSDHITFQNNLIYNTTTVQGDGIFAHSGNGVTACKFINNIFSKMRLGIYSLSPAGSDNYYYDNTVHGCTTGLNLAYYQGFWKNNISIGNTNNWINADNNASQMSNNAYETGNPATMYGSSNKAVTPTNTFTDYANQDYSLKAGGACIGAGVDLSSTFTIDVAGTTRTTPWDIGAFKYTAAAPIGARLVGDSALVGDSLLVGTSALVD